MKTYYVNFVGNISGEITAENEEDAIEQLKYSMKSDSYSNSEFEVEEIELTKKVIGL